MFRAIILLLVFLVPFSVSGKEYIFPFFNFTEAFYGANPRDAGIIIDGDYIYGTTYAGGMHTAGTIFRVKKDGTDYKILHHFTGSSTTIQNGKPRGKLLLVDGVLYGNCSFYGGNFGGAVYSIKTDGTDFKLLADFYDGTGAFTHGKFPGYGGLTMVDGVLYGTTSSGGNGGSPGNGVLFSLNKDGSNFKTFYKFPTDKATGKSCYTGLIYKDGWFYGAATDGGINDDGTLFAIKPDGTGIKVLKHFVYAEGYSRLSPNLLIGDTLYMQASEGGGNHRGTLSSIKTDGTDFKVLHSFNLTDGDDPGVYGAMVAIGDYLYGATKQGGEDFIGVLFRIKKDGTGFEVLDHFSTVKGSNYKGTMIYESPYLIGTANTGGTKGYGTIFRYYIGDINSAVITYSADAGITTAKLWGNAYVKDGYAILEKGFCWGMNSDPDMDDNVKVAGSGAGKFVADIYSLMPGKTYYVRAYVKTAMGIFYGENRSFKAMTPMVSGKVTMDGQPLAGVVVNFVGREKLITAADGSYSTYVWYGWTGTIELSKDGYTFSPATYTGNNVKENIEVNFTATKNE